jgi:Tfp pilus assembly protein PilF
VTLTLALGRSRAEPQPLSPPAVRIASTPAARSATRPVRAPEPVGRWLRPAEERLEAGRIAEACALGLVASEHAPRVPAVWEFLGRCYMRLSEPKEARAYYRKYLALAPSGPDAPFIRSITERDEP